MPIIYTHGVNTRDPKHFEPVKKYLQRIVAPAIARDPQAVSIQTADWFHLCEPPRWDGESRPPTLLGQGAAPIALDEKLVLRQIVDELPRSAAAPTGELHSGRVSSPSVRLDALADDRLADLIQIAASGSSATPLQRAAIGIAADAVAHDPEVRTQLSATKSLDEQLKILADALQPRIETTEELRAQGALDIVRSLKDRVGEAVSRTLDAPAAAASLVAGENRPELQAFVTRFLGDILYYVTLRGTASAPGSIPTVLIEKLQEADANSKARGSEPIVLLTHSMGGQIAYDVLSTFLPAAKSDIKVGYWCASASQVPYFEEMKLLLASSPLYSKARGNKAPFPSAHLNHWWNVWDRNDILSFTAEKIFEGVEDSAFWSGMSVLSAHGGYLERPSFYRAFAERLRKAFPPVQGA